MNTRQTILRKATKQQTVAPMTKRRKRRSPEEIKERLLTATRDEFKKSGYAATTAAIAQHADVTEGQLYRYFDSKKDLFREAVFKPLNKELADFGARYLADISNMTDRKERARLYITRLQEFINDHSELLMALAVAKPYQGEGTLHVSELGSLFSFFDLGAVLLESRKSKANPVNAKLMSKIIFATVLSSVMYKDWLFPEYEADSDEIVDAIGEYLIASVHANTGFEE